LMTTTAASRAIPHQTVRTRRAIETQTNRPTSETRRR
jgi:hypothetical protein